jgi:hypothetical protein
MLLIDHLLEFWLVLFTRCDNWWLWALFLELGVGRLWVLCIEFGVWGFCFIELGVARFYAGMDIGVCGVMGVAMFVGLGVWMFYIMAIIGLCGIFGIRAGTWIVCKIMGT